MEIGFSIPHLVTDLQPVGPLFLVSNGKPFRSAALEFQSALSDRRARWMEALPAQLTTHHSPVKSIIILVSASALSHIVIELLMYSVFICPPVMGHGDYFTERDRAYMAVRRYNSKHLSVNES